MERSPRAPGDGALAIANFPDLSYKIDLEIKLTVCFEQRSGRNGITKRIENWQKNRCAAQKFYASRVARRWSAQRIDCGAGRCRTTGGSLACPANRARKREGASKE